MRLVRWFARAALETAHSRRQPSAWGAIRNRRVWYKLLQEKGLEPAASFLQLGSRPVEHGQPTTRVRSDLQLHVHLAPFGPAVFRLFALAHTFQKKLAMRIHDCLAFWG